MFAPNTFLIGAQKSGTTYLASRLDQSPDVCVCDPKEPQFFSLYHETAALAYEKSFANRAAKITLDASTTYTFLRPRQRMGVEDAPGLMQPVPERIRAAAPNARFIYIMRDPVARAISAYKHNMRRNPDAPAGEQSLIRAFEADPMLELVSRYGDQIERYFESFACETFLFLRFENMIADPETTIRQCAAFLDIDPAPILAAEEAGETHGAHALSGAGRVLARAPGLKASLKRMVPKGLQSALSERLLRRPAPEVIFTDKAEAAERFADDRAKVRDLTGLEV